MTDFFFSVLLIPYGLVLAALFFYGLNFVYLVVQAWRYRGSDPQAPPIERPVTVSVQVPIFNERYVAKRAVDAAAQLRWPRELLEVQVLDDSTDDTVDIVRARVEYWRARGVSVEHVHREKRVGYKAGALAEGTQKARGEFLAVFDADFVPPPDFLERTIPHLVSNEDLAFVQTRWGHINNSRSLLTRLQAVALDAHFGVEQFARSRAGHMFNFNGTAGVWRREAVDDVGGWQARTLTEDLDLSYRVLLGGWRGLFLRDLVAPAELPPTMAAFRRQQARWAQGSIECAIYLLPDIMRSSMRPRDKVQAVFHLSGYSLHLLLIALGLLYPLVAVAANQRPQIASLYGVGVLFAMTIFAPTLFFLYGQVVIRRDWWRVVPRTLAVSVLGVGMMLNTMRASIRALRKGERVFERTPKWGLNGGGGRTYMLGVGHDIWLEVVWGLFNLGVGIFAASRGQFIISVYALMFGVGALYVAFTTWHHERATMRAG